MKSRNAHRTRASLPQGKIGRTRHGPCCSNNIVRRVSARFAVGDANARHSHDTGRSTDRDHRPAVDLVEATARRSGVRYIEVQEVARRVERHYETDAFIRSRCCAAKPVSRLARQCPYCIRITREVHVESRHGARAGARLRIRLLAYCQ